MHFAEKIAKCDFGTSMHGDSGLGKGKVVTAETPIRIRNKRNIGKYWFKKQNPAGASSWSRKKDHMSNFW